MCLPPNGRTVVQRVTRRVCKNVSLNELLFVFFFYSNNFLLFPENKKKLQKHSKYVWYEDTHTYVRTYVRMYIIKPQII